MELPLLVQIKIAEYLGTKGVIMLQKVCKHWHTYWGRGYFWKSVDLSGITMPRGAITRIGKRVGKNIRYLCVDNCVKVEELGQKCVNLEYFLVKGSGCTSRYSKFKANRIQVSLGCRCTAMWISKAKMFWGRIDSSACKMDLEIAVFSRLIELKLWDVNEIGAKIIANAPKLRILYLYGIKESEMKTISEKLKQIRHLSVESSPVNLFDFYAPNETIKTLTVTFGHLKECKQKMGSLTSLSIVQGCIETGALKRIIAENPQLRKINLRDSHITQESKQELRKMQDTYIIL